MTRLRMPIAQPPRATRNSDRNGSSQWEARSLMNCQLNRGIRFAEYDREVGSHSICTAKNQINNMASHMYGVAVSTYETGSTVLSSALRRAARAPSLLPTYQLSRIAGTSSAKV